MARLFEPLVVRGLTVPNRIVVSPMCQYSAVDGDATAWHVAHLGGLALGGAGLLCVEATAVAPEGRITHGCLGLWSDANEAALARVIGVIRGASPIKLALQLAHAGRKASSAVPWRGGQLIAPGDGGWLPEAPSAVPHRPGEPPPRAMTARDLTRVKQAFADAAGRAVALGFDALELHAAHGYLLHEFLSPVANHRADEYGGTLENRMRYPLEIFRAVRAAVPDRVPVGVRVSGTDWLEGEPSWTLEQTIALARALEASGADWIDVSSGGISPRQEIAAGPGYQVPLAEAIKRATRVPTIAVGMIGDPHQAEQIVAGGSADLVALARAMLYDPRWVWRAAEQLGHPIDGPPQYWRMLPAGKNKVFASGAVAMR
jgi:NADPH2 dehydrogenase